VIRTTLLFLTFLLSAALFTSCGSLAGAGAPNAAGALGELPGDWRVTEIGGKGLVDGVELSLAFGQDGAFTGESGVNRLRATYTAQGEGLSFAPVMATRMAGLPELMEQEQRLLNALEETRSFTLQGGQLGLVDGAGVTLLLARRR